MSSNANKKRKQSTQAAETLEQKKERLRRELTEVEQDQCAAAAEKTANAMNEFFAKPSAALQISRAIQDHLVFAAPPKIMVNISHHLYSPLQNCRYDKAFALRFQSATRNRTWEYRMIASNIDGWGANHLELECFEEGKTEPTGKHVQPMAYNLLDSGRCYRFETDATKPFHVGLLPFDEKTRTLIMDGNELLFHVLLFERITEICLQFCAVAAKYAPPGNAAPELHRAFMTAIHRLRTSNKEDE